MHKLIQFGKQKYSVKDIKVKEVCLEDIGADTKISVIYKGVENKDLIFLVPNKEGVLDTKIISDLYVEIMSANDEAINSI